MPAKQENYVLPSYLLFLDGKKGTVVWLNGRKTPGSCHLCLCAPEV